MGLNRSIRSQQLTLWVLAISLVALAHSRALVEGAETKLLRFPDVHQDKVVFCYAGDLWIVSSTGGTAARLTSHDGAELFPKFSPDGRWLAFTGQYEGDEQVYVMPTSGGAPQRLTFYPARGPLPPRWGYDHQVYGWAPDSFRILFRSLRDGWSLSQSRLFTIGLEGGLPEPLPMPLSGGGDFSPDGRKVVYSPLFRDFRTWKRYQGGWAQDLYIFDLDDFSTVQITDHPRTDRDPMWIGDTIYFSSDRTGTLNLFSYSTESEKLEQLTHYTEWDLRWPSKGDEGRIVYELRGDLHIFDTKSGQQRKLDIFVPDDAIPRRPARIDVADRIEDFSLSPKGERALFVARGDLFSAPIEKGPTRNLTQSSGAHDRWARWSPDGKNIAFISDQTGEDEVYLVPQDGSSKPERLTDGGTGMRYAPVWAPDGKRIAFSDKDGKLFVLTLAARALKEIADEKRGQVRDYTWSPQGGHLAFSLTDENGFNSIHIWSADDDQVRRITGELFNEFDPAWDPEGKYLFYLSDREFAPQLGSFEWNYVGNRETGIFALALRRDVPHPFPPESDEVSIDDEESADSEDDPKKEEEEEDEDKDKDEEEEEEEPDGDSDSEDEDKDDGDSKDRDDDGESDDREADGKGDYIKIDFDGLADRVARVPVESDNLAGLASVKGHLLYLSRPPSYYGRSSEDKTTLHIFSIEDRENTVLVNNATGYAVSSDGSKILVREGSSYNLYDAKPKGKESKKTVSTAGLKMIHNPAEEWAEIFDEVWRRFRDFFYVENMHGYDWAAIREQYEPLLRHVGHRADLNYLLGEMVAELNVSHAYIAGGDFETPPRPQVALPGARFELDQDAGRYRIARIFKGHNEEERYRSPLTEIGVDVKEGDYVLAIDGEELSPQQNPYQLLLYKADHPVELTVNSEPEMEGARQVKFRPVTSENHLVYLSWVLGNRERVQRESDGRLAYLHVPDMSADGIREFIKWFYGQIRAEGLIIDVRNNGGGNVSQMLIERLRRELLATTFSRTVEDARTYPGTVFHGPMVCLVNENSASDGDIFPAMFKRAGLGPLIGKRTWGGVIGITGRGTLIDGGSVFVPEFGFASPKGEWIIEGYGVDPDVVVENDPQSIIEGGDPQLERGIQEALKLLQQTPHRLPSRPPPPVRTE